MSRTLSQTALQALLAQNTSQAFVMLMKIEHADLTEPIRVALSNEDIASNGETYKASNFQVNLPQERENDPPRVSVSVDNVDRNIVAGIRTISGAPTFSLQVVLKSSPNTVEISASELTMRNAEWDEQTVTGELTYEDILNEPLGRRFIPKDYPALFQKAA